MARPSLDCNIQTKTARKKLKPRTGGDPAYYRAIGANKSLGYIARATGAGVWQVRERTAGRYRTRIVGAADDVARADGDDVLTFEQALAKAAKPGLPLSIRASLTVRSTCERYFEVLESRSDHAKEARQRAEKHIFPALGDYRVDRLTKTQIESWLASLVREDPDDDDARRRSQDTANRILTILKAALNSAYADDANNIPSDSAWRKVKPFKNVSGARPDHFGAVDVRKLIAKANSFDKAFANLLEASYLTGGRYGELVQLRVEDFDAQRSVLTIRQGKTGAREVSLTQESVAFFSKLCEGRSPTDLLLPKAAGGARWGKSQQHRPFKRAAAMAGLPASASLYSLRHSLISRSIDGHMPLTLLASNTGTSLQMIERNYAKNLASQTLATIEATSPKLRLRRVK